MVLAYDRLLRDVQACVGILFFNYELDRTYGTKTTTTSTPKSPGFTEVWGVEEENDDTVVKNPQTIADTRLTEADTENNENVMIVWQHRPAWAEQLVLHVAGITYHVRNVPYAVMEVTGPLPCCLWNTTAATTNKNTNNTSGTFVNSPSWVLLGRHQQPQGPHNKYQNHILESLEDDSRIKKKLSKVETSATVYLMLHILVDVLPRTWTILTYQDRQAWFAVHQGQSLASYTNGKRQWFFAQGLFQTWCERHFALYALEDENATATTSVESAVQQATEAFQMLEEQLNKAGSNNNNNSMFLLGTRNMTMLDALLFEQLMQALGNVHLVMVLQKFPRLCQYLEQIWNLFVDKNDSNNAINAVNTFWSMGYYQSLLSSATTTTTKNHQPFQTALELMTNKGYTLQQRLSLHAASITSSVPHSNNSSNQASSNTTTGGSSSTIPDDAAAAALKSHRRGDELWLAATLCATITAFGYAVFVRPNNAVH